MRFTSSCVFKVHIRYKIILFLDLGPLRDLTVHCVHEKSKKIKSLNPHPQTQASQMQDIRPRPTGSLLAVRSIGCSIHICRSCKAELSDTCPHSHML